MSTAVLSSAGGGDGGAAADQPLTEGAEAREPTLMPGMVKRETPLRTTAQISVFMINLESQGLGNVIEGQAIV